MLKHLHIQNYALISHLDIDFRDGFCVMTGETGAGKSIIIGALNLVLGDRADTKAISEGYDKCIIEATFDDCIVRRELYSSGRSRSLVDDAVVSLNELKALAAKWIDIHSQHENLLLQDDKFQLSVVDSIAKNEEIRAEYGSAYADFLQTQKELSELEALATKSQKDLDYLTYQFKELDSLHLTAGEVAQLEEELSRLSHAEEIKMALGETHALLDGDQGNGILQNMQMVVGALDKVQDFLPAAREMTERFRSAYEELKDLDTTLLHENDAVEGDPARLQLVHERLDTVYSLFKKHKVETEEELMALHAQMQKQLEHIDSYEADIRTLRAALSQKEAILRTAAQRLTDSRMLVRDAICEVLVQNLVKLGIPHAKIEIAFSDTDYTSDGKDNVQFLFSANLNQSLRPVAQIASGGEISRIMLCIKALIASTSGLPTIIFDEIDTGVSGAIANQMGCIMQQIAATRQVITITHLPQIAAKGTTQYKVYKEDSLVRTETHIKELSAEERVMEIATMLSGDAPTPSAIENAKQLLNE